MVTKDNNNGLLARMVKLIRRPAQDALESVVSVMGRESEFNKLALKERIERKRQDDAIRRREFNHLRKLRNDGPLTGRYVAGKRVEFQNSVGFNPQERALTVKKIDAIEAQLSRHWFELKQSESASLESKLPRASAGPKHAIPKLTDPVRATAHVPLQAPPSRAQSAPLHSADVESTQMDLIAPADLGTAKAPSQQVPPQVAAFRNSRHSSFEAGISGFSNSKLMSVELGQGLGDPGLQEAAIRFADGDEEGAEGVLLAMLQADTEQSDAAAGCAAALFDLYRATGQQASFDVVAMDFAQRFGRSPPEWFSTPDLLANKTVAAAADPAPLSGPRRELVWECPAELDLSAVQGLRAMQLSSKTPLRLQWNLLKLILPDAVKELESLFGQWCAQPVQLFFAGEDALEKALKVATPAADKRVDPIWWRVRLDALRILKLQDTFEAVAMDFCLLYEVSPPAWADARCDCVCERGLGATPPVDAFLVEMDSENPEMVVELTGQILGDAVEMLDKFQRGLEERDALAISCAKLIRVDFSAAGSILNWVAERELQGCQVLFFDVPRLVAALFTVMGINDHARVVLRTK